MLGLLIASSPMMATALGSRPNAVRDVRRTFRAGLWLLVLAASALLAPAVARRQLHAGVRRKRRALHAKGRLSCGPTCGARRPGSCSSSCAISFLRSSGRESILWLSISGIALNALLSWSLIFGHFGMPALGLVGGGLGSTLTWLVLCGALVILIQRDRQFRRFHLFGHWWRFDRQRTAAMVRLGWPIGLTMALEMGVFALAAYFMGWIGAPAVAAHAVALQLAALTFMVPLGLGQAATVRVGLALGRRDEAAIARAGWTAWVIGVGFMGDDGARDVEHSPRRSSPCSSTTFLRTPSSSALLSASFGSQRHSSWSTARR